MQEKKEKIIYRRSKEDRRKVHTFLMNDRRSGPFCRRQGNTTISTKIKRSPPGQLKQNEHWDWRLGQWVSIR